MALSTMRVFLESKVSRHRPTAIKLLGNPAFWQEFIEALSVRYHNEKDFFLSAMPPETPGEVGNGANENGDNNGQDI